MRKKTEALKQLAKPPSVANWAGHNFLRFDETRRGLLRFAKSPPRHSLGPVYAICEWIVVDRIPLAQALKCANTIKHPAAKKAALGIIPAFYAYVRENNLDGLATFRGFRQPYPIGRSADGATMTVPVAPTFTILHDEEPTPVFLIGWSSKSLTDYQKRLFSTIVQNAILTLQGFENSDALVVLTPSYKECRTVRSWLVRQYATLSQDQLLEQFDRYSAALADVIAAVSAEPDDDPNNRT